MSLNIKPSTSTERTQLFFEILYGKTSKLNKIADNSVISGVGNGVSKVSGKAEKDIALSLSKLFPDSAASSQLDQVAQNNGIAARFGGGQSSTFVRVVGAVGTTYTAGTHSFQANDGSQFDIEQTKVIGVHGFEYVKVRSVNVGESANIPSGNIVKVTPVPAGHLFCTNEYQAQYGRDAESDTLFRQRIKNSPNLNASATLARLEQVFMLINPNVLECRFQGMNSLGQVKIAIVTQNGIALNNTELGDLLTKGERYFSFTELRPFGRQSYGVQLMNIDYQPIDVSFRCELYSGYNPDDVRKDIQVRMGKYLDFRYFKPGVDKVEWDNLLEIAKNTAGIKYVPDTYFYPGIDIATDPNKIPRFRGFLMMDLSGNILNNIQNSFNPIFYPSQADFSFQQTALKSIV